ncbi:hypothetical protein KC571_02555 [candidate division WWE3 bacterium]|uniref:Polymerase nucleotidyl transferase domain-containing protein n=1 Tax=candidate division WWE3 bacterium TaxID=2053526 RepID=A0A955LH89_UNCKA|nr:hypothetical protein [candidate division WWE3 bacterium]
MGSYETLLGTWHKTIQYSNIFDYPLTIDEIHLYAIGNHPISLEQFKSWVEKNQLLLNDQFTCVDDLWSVKGRSKIAPIRQKRSKISQNKVQHAKRILAPLRIIPWISFIGISGATAANNSRFADDIDLFIITQPNRMWLSRALILIYLTLIRQRYNMRQRAKNARPSFCVNHIITTKELTQKHQDIYVANDIARLQTVINKGQTYEKFIAANEWVKNYLCNWWEIKGKHITITESLRATLEKDPQLHQILFIVSAPIRMPFVLLSWVIDLMEKATQSLQKQRLYENELYVETSTPPLQFHPHDNRDWVIREYLLAMRKTNY